MEIKRKIGAISREISEYCHYAIPKNRARDRKNPGKKAESERAATARRARPPQTWASVETKSSAGHDPAEFLQLALDFGNPTVFTLGLGDIELREQDRSAILGQ